nr:ribonuclease [uncultured Blautia sp.]
MELLLTNMTILLGVIGILAFAVSIIVQVFKGVSFLKKIPTDILVFVLSIGLTVTAFVAYMQYIQQTILWYMILAAILAGLLVAFVAMYGWEKVSKLWKRFYKGNVEGK